MMKSSSETQDFAFVSIAIITLISLVGKPPTAKESKAATGLILATTDLVLNYDFVMGVKNYIEKKIKDDFFHFPSKVFEEIGKVKLRPDQAALAIDLGVKYLLKNETITQDKISIIEEVSERIGIQFKRPLSFWLK